MNDRPSLNHPSETFQNAGRAFCVGVALILLLIGGSFAFWVVDFVKALLATPEAIPLIEPLVQANQSLGRNGIEIQVQGEQIIIQDSPYFRTILAIGLLFVVLNVLGRVIAAFITGGVKLLYGVFGPAPKYYGDRKDR